MYWQLEQSRAYNWRLAPMVFAPYFFQGHPEYDRISLMKEHKREVGLYFNGTLQDYPPVPQHYLDSFTLSLLDEYRLKVIDAREAGGSPPPYPESLIQQRLHNTWHDSGEAVVGNWIGLVYQITNAKRHLPFMQGINPEDPLGWHR